MGAVGLHRVSLLCGVVDEMTETSGSRYGPPGWTRGSEREEVLVTYTLQLIGPQVYSFRDAAALKMRMDELARETEENLTDLLPPGYSVKIREWDKEDA